MNNFTSEFEKKIQKELENIEDNIESTIEMETVNLLEESKIDEFPKECDIWNHIIMEINLNGLRYINKTMLKGEILILNNELHKIIEFTVHEYADEQIMTKHDLYQKMNLYCKRVFILSTWLEQQQRCDFAFIFKDKKWTTEQLHNLILVYKRITPHLRFILVLMNSIFA